MSLGQFVMPPSSTAISSNTRQLNVPPAHLWQTQSDNTVLLNPNLGAYDLSTKHIVLVPGPQFPTTAAGEALLHVMGDTVLLQRANASRVTTPHVTVLNPNSVHYIIRCWVVAEHCTDDGPCISVELDRIVSRDGVPYAIQSATTHNAILVEVCNRLQCETPSVKFNVMWRGDSRCVRELWDMAQNVIPFNCIGIRFETPSAVSSASDHIWIAGAVGAPTLDLLDGMAKRHVLFADADFIVTRAASIYPRIVALHESALGSSEPSPAVMLGSGAFRVPAAVLRHVNEAQST
jgi:hypothetical protein